LVWAWALTLASKAAPASTDDRREGRNFIDGP
jgi:hypothetical protein